MSTVLFSSDVFYIVHNSSVWLPSWASGGTATMKGDAKEGQIRIVCFKAESLEF